MSCKLIIKPLNVTLHVKYGTCLSDVLKHYNIEFPCGGKGLCGNCKVRILSGKVNISKTHKEILKSKHLEGNWCLACLVHIEDNLTIEIPQGKMPIQFDEETIYSCNKEDGFAIAVDLGSTTVVTQLINLENGSVVCTRTGKNPQSVYGADIISRIAFSTKSPKCSIKLTKLIRNFIGKQIKEITSYSPNLDIKKVRIVGNTVMHHIFIGLDLSCLASYPFHSDYNSNYKFIPAQLEWDLPPNCLIEFLPNISHFVGSDIIAGIISCEILKSEKNILLVDLGTNGEIVLGNKYKMWCTSTAAGPAFEGINISCGMHASSGAICSSKYNNGKFEIETIDNIKPIGLCGSGLLETISTLLKNGLIDYNGTIVPDGINDFRLYDNIILSAKDIREFQLAKAAIATGIEILIKYSLISIDEISEVYITGGLGNYVNFDTIKNLGLFPYMKNAKYKKIINAALNGCKKLLYESEYLKIKNIIDKVNYCPLEIDSSFMDLFCCNINFPTK